MTGERKLLLSNTRYSVNIYTVGNCILRLPQVIPKRVSAGAVTLESPLAYDS